MGNKLYVGNLAYNVRDDDLQQAFAQFGTVTSAKVMMDRDTGRSKGFGFVEMGTDAEAQAAINGMNGQALDGRAIVVNEARPREERPGGFGGGGGGGGDGGGGGGGGGGYGGGGGRSGGGGYGGGGRRRRWLRRRRRWPLRRWRRLRRRRWRPLAVAAAAAAAAATDALRAPAGSRRRAVQRKRTAFSHGARLGSGGACAAGPASSAVEQRVRQQPQQLGDHAHLPRNDAVARRRARWRGRPGRRSRRRCIRNGMA